MLPIRLSVVGVLLVGLQAISIAPASAAPCGARDPQTHKAFKGALELNEDEAEVDKAFERDTGKESLLLAFTVSGCRIPSDAAPPTLDVLPRKAIADLPTDAVSLNRATPDTTTFDVVIDVDGGKFDPGSYGALVALRAPYLVTTRTPITVSRSEDSWLIPLCIGVLAALVGFLVFSLKKIFDKKPLKVGAGMVVLAVVIAAGVGAYLALVNYFDQDVWTVEANWKATAAIAFVGGTTGLMAGLLGGMWGGNDNDGGG
jgi:hypothetical protein